MATTEQLTVWLQKAEAAYHDLVTGKQAKVLVDQSGERIEYQIANAGRLLAYIEWLKAQLGMTSTAVPGPMRVYL